VRLVRLEQRATRAVCGSHRVRHRIARMEAPLHRGMEDLPTAGFFCQEIGFSRGDERPRGFLDTKGRVSSGRAMAAACHPLSRTRGACGDPHSPVNLRLTSPRLRLGDVRARDLHGSHVEALVTDLSNAGACSTRPGSAARASRRTAYVTRSPAGT